MKVLTWNDNTGPVALHYLIWPPRVTGHTPHFSSIVCFNWEVQLQVGWVVILEGYEPPSSHNGLESGCVVSCVNIPPDDWSGSIPEFVKVTLEHGCFTSIIRQQVYHIIFRLWLKLPLGCTERVYKERAYQLANGTAMCNMYTVLRTEPAFSNFCHGCLHHDAMLQINKTFQYLNCCNFVQMSESSSHHT